MVPINATSADAEQVDPVEAWIQVAPGELTVDRRFNLGVYGKTVWWIGGKREYAAMLAISAAENKSGRND